MSRGVSPGGSSGCELGAVDDWRARFMDAFGVEPSVAASAPGRVNLIGEHVDYCDGFVLPLAIQLRAAVAVAPSPDALTRVRSTAFPESVEVDASTIRFPRPTETFADRLLGVLAAFEGVPPVSLLVHSGVPVGGGLSSSAAVEVATALVAEFLSEGGAALPPPREEVAPEHTAPSHAAEEHPASQRSASQHLHGHAPPHESRSRAARLAERCQWAEHTAAAVPCGIMDMLVSVGARAGHAMFVDCRARRWEHVPLFARWPAPPELLVIDTRVTHDHASGAYASRRAECEAAASALGVPSLRDVDEATVGESSLRTPLIDRALHVTSENRRVQECVAALRERREEDVGSLLFASHASLRDRFGVSCPELDHLVESAALRRGDGVLGARLTGGGFGGCAIVLVAHGAATTIGAELAESFERRFGHRPTLFTARACDGAELL